MTADAGEPVTTSIYLRIVRRVESLLGHVFIETKEVRQRRQPVIS